MIAIIDCGSLWTIEICKKIEKFGFNFKIFNFNSLLESTNAITDCKKIIISGRPTLLSKENIKDHFKKFAFVLETKIPILGICYGHQIIALLYGSKIFVKEHINKKEEIEILNFGILFKRLNSHAFFREDHSEFVTLPKNFVLLAKSKSCVNEAMKHNKKPIYSVQFHPEVSGKTGEILLGNFLNIDN